MGGTCSCAVLPLLLSQGFSSRFHSGFSLCIDAMAALLDALQVLGVLDQAAGKTCVPSCPVAFWLQHFAEIAPLSGSWCMCDPSSGCWVYVSVLAWSCIGFAAAVVPAVGSGQHGVHVLSVPCRFSAGDVEDGIRLCSNLGALQCQLMVKCIALDEQLAVDLETGSCMLQLF